MEKCQQRIKLIGKLKDSLSHAYSTRTCKMEYFPGSLKQDLITEFRFIRVTQCHNTSRWMMRGKSKKASAATFSTTAVSALFIVTQAMTDPK